MLLYLLPGVAACLYAAGSMSLKTAMVRGAAARRVIVASNLAMALWSLPLLFFFEWHWDLRAWLAAVAAGAALFVGRIFAIKALEAGDLSIVAPLLGMKTVLVALLSMVFFPWQVSAAVVAAAVMASLGVGLLGRGPAAERRSTRRAALYALGASLLFAATDILVQGSARTLGIGLFHPTLFLTVGFLSPLLGRTAAVPAPSRKALVAGSLIMGIQTPLVVLTIGLMGEAVLVNVVYSTRALWSVIGDRLFGAAHVRQFFVSRLLGALLITAAVAMAIMSRV